MTIETSSNRVFMELKFGPKWKYLSTVRTFIESFVAITIENIKRAGTVALAINELIENAIKYSDSEGIEIQMDVLREKNMIHATVVNHAEDVQIKIFQKFLGEINSMKPLDAYLARMQEIAKHPEGKGGLGLARIRYESDALLSYTKKDGTVTVFADIPITVKGE